MDSFLAFLHQNDEVKKIKINQTQKQDAELQAKKNTKCNNLKNKYNDCVRLNRYILGNLFNDKICIKLLKNYEKECK